MKRILVLVFVAIFSGGVATAQKALKSGDKAPAFSAMTDEGTTWKSSDFIGKKNIVLYFYPAAMTGGCTKQACSYRDHQAELTAADAVVVGISGDEVSGLKFFKEANQLNFTLLSDSDGKIATLFGVPVTEGGTIKRTVHDREVELTRGVTAKRWTFIIGKDGKIRYVNQQVDAENDYQAVLDVLKG